MTQEEKQKILETEELSEEELQTVHGGVKINWPADCSSTVKDGDFCGMNDACYYLLNKYYRSVKTYGCSATATAGGTCWSDDNCKTFEIRYDFLHY